VVIPGCNALDSRVHGPELTIAQRGACVQLDATSMQAAHPRRGGVPARVW
jgi:hypothetical protein